MNIITDDMRDIVARAMLSFAATVCPDGTPNLSPKGSVRVHDGDHLVFMDIASPNTIANLEANPGIEINSIDVFRRRGYRFKGTAKLIPAGEEVYEDLHAWLLDLNGPGYPAHQAVLVQVERAEPILSPAYTFGNATEHALTDSWTDRYRAVNDTGTDPSTSHHPIEDNR
ncbi:pyridoxamine 5'-phosphate oxidase family protein [Rhodococcus opacus]|uniref:pyridoxamine 5'-phosphate oxidase family protein n=1 Tax=Rhodococcus opacus TaxID=37919 RepID=UPI001C454CD4|nr:pyridoxamine 5'-phosphate oxidase family protein [Rhodococcus opacus]MBV6755886.1 pyridoxamine 5'-phosphate oxidase family protein [Rhodococcus opacus]